MAVPGTGTKTTETAASAAAPAARRGRSSLLEYSQNVVTNEKGEQSFEAIRCGCDCWYCDDCCRRKGYTLRAELMPVLRTFAGRMMLTLTVDPELFPTPRDAYLYIRKARAISRLMQDLDRGGHLHSRRYLYVVEFQEKSEQAHFHVLIDASFVPKTAIDAAWSKFRPQQAGPVAPNRPAFGTTRFSRRSFEGGAEHAARYMTKYLVKTPEYGWPTWVLEMGAKKRVPRYRASRGFWNRPSARSLPTGAKRTVVPRSYGERVAECGTTTNLFAAADRVDHSTGEVSRVRVWRARLEVPVAALAVAGEPCGKAGRCVVVEARGEHACIAALSMAAGLPIRVIASASGVRRAADTGVAE
ncbi:MAG: hypothetical protein KF745_10690 [Phycisphaeraceae bacterium]|nr:hypothetical protein [Phycisphaeraceae bacterium]